MPLAYALAKGYLLICLCGRFARFPFPLGASVTPVAPRSSAEQRKCQATRSNTQQVKYQRVGEVNTKRIFNRRVATKGRLKKRLLAQVGPPGALSRTAIPQAPLFMTDLLL